LHSLITLDYELFTGPHTGSVGRTLLEPTLALAGLARRLGVRLVFFVDAGYLLRLREEKARAPVLRADYDAVCRQVEGLARGGHEIQLHIHPHWEDCAWTEHGWRMDTRRFALHAFAPDEVRAIVLRYAKVLRELAGADAAYAYRAGGWVVQPFESIGPALRAAGVTIDSTVYRGGRSASPMQPFDFRGAPDKSRWRFDTDPLAEAPDGPFLEVPIASHRVGPLFYWRHALAGKLGGERHRPFGDGRTLPLPPAELARKLVTRSASVVSIDGYKASFLEEAAASFRARGFEDFVVIGHPKALTPYSLERLQAFVAAARRFGTVGTFDVYRNEMEGRSSDALAA
jgi:hypothetical protein